MSRVPTLTREVGRILRFITGKTISEYAMVMTLKIA